MNDNIPYVLDPLAWLALQDKLRREDHRTDEEKRKALVDAVRSLKVEIPPDYLWDRDDANAR